MALLSWPKRRPLADSSGDEESAGSWVAVISPARLELWPPAGDDGALDGPLIFTDAAELRAFAMIVYAAAIEHDLDVQEAAVKASIARRRERGLGGNRHRPVIERPEPPMHMSLEMPA